LQDDELDDSGTESTDSDEDKDNGKEAKHYDDEALDGIMRKPTSSEITISGDENTRLAILQ